MASAAARLLFLTGFRVVVLERAQPLAVRRLVSFAQAVFDGEVVVEGVRGRRAEAGAIEPSTAQVTVAVDEEARGLASLRPEALVDARMLKRNEGTSRSQAPLVVALGPGFTAGVDVHAVVETHRGPDLGRVLWSGAAEKDTARPAPVLGYTEERVVRAPGSGRFEAVARLGDVVARGDLLGRVGGHPVLAVLGGRLRGLVADGVSVAAGVKLGDIDPRGAAVAADRISDKARAVAVGVLEAVLIGTRS